MNLSYRNGNVWRLSILLAGCITSLARAEVPAQDAERRWSLLLELMYMDAFGHDQHILNIHRVDVSSTPTVGMRTPVTLDTESGPGYRFEFQYTPAEDWGLGLDFFWFNTSQGRPTFTVAPTANIGQATFEAADRSFTSNDPGQILQFSVLEDTDLATWTADLYGMKTFAETAKSSLRLHFGVRNADFDNDYHSIVGLQNTGGSLIDASSNYGRMIGPLIGFSAGARFGKHSLRGYLGQSVVFGTAELSQMTRDFTGGASAPAITAQESFGKDQDTAIPITEFRISWLYPIGRRLSLGLSANTSIWWDVPVPPGVVPIANGDAVFHENTLVFFGLAVAVQL